MYWMASNIVRFKPKNRFQSGATYTVKVKLSSLSDLEDFTYELKIREQSADINLKGLKSYDKSSLKWQQLEGELRLADFADEAQFSGFIAQQGERKLPITWTFDKSRLIQYFTVDSVQRTLEESEVKVTWSTGGPLDLKNSGERVKEIPSINNFKVVGSNIQNDPNQFIVLQFSEELRAKQNLEGLITINNGHNFTLERKGEELFLYPKSRLDGTVTVKVNQGVKNFLGYTLKTEYTKAFSFSNINPMVKAVNNGNILPSTDQFKFPFMAVNLDSVVLRILEIKEDNLPYFLQVNTLNGKREIRRFGRQILEKTYSLKDIKKPTLNVWDTYFLDLENLFEIKKGHLYRVYISFEKEHSIFPCDKAIEQTEPTREETIQHEQAKEKFYDDASGWYDNDFYYSYDGNYSWRYRDNPCYREYFRPNQGKEIFRNILATDLGIIAKGGENKTVHLAVSDLTTTLPVAQANVTLFNLQGEEIKTGKTNSEGFYSATPSQTAFLAKVETKSDINYLKLVPNLALSTSMFNTGGSSTQGGVRGYIYGDRGVWRPGDTLFLSFMLHDPQQSIPANHPVIFEIYNARNQMVHKDVLNQGLNGFYCLNYPTSPIAETGFWNCKVIVGSTIFNKQLAIETVKPNRIKIELNSEDKLLHLTKGKITSKVDLHAEWMHGGLAKGLKADVELKVNAAHTQFKNFENYHFDDPVKAYRTRSNKVFEGRLDQNGDVSFTPNLAINTSDCGGILSAQFITRVFEESGSFSKRSKNLKISPFNQYVGVQLPKGNGYNKALDSKKEHGVAIALVDDKGKPLSGKVKIEVFTVSYRSWWQRNGNDNLASYVNNSSNYRIVYDTIVVKNGKAVYPMKFKTNRWGRNFFRATSLESGHSAGEVFYTTYHNWWRSNSNSSNSAAEMLSLTPSKQNYEVGEIVRIEVPTPKKGRFLVSLEKGGKVIHQFWQEMDQNDGAVEFLATQEMTPNVYAFVSLIQPHGNVENDAPIRLYGVNSISIHDPATQLEPVLDMDDEIEPLTNNTIEISEKNGKAMTYTVAIVDEGLLDLTNFKTPNAWNSFYSKEALRVRTWDMYKEVIGANQGLLTGLLRVGGGDGEDNSKEGNQNRFKPIVKFMGPFELKPGKSNEHELNLPNYFGRVRAMVVAGQNGAYGSEEKSVFVRKPLMVFPTAPRIVGPQEVFKLPVHVFANKDNIKSATVRVETSDIYEVVGNAKQQVSFEQESEALCYFEIRSKAKVGDGKITVNVQGGGSKSFEIINLKVRVPNVATHVTKKGIANQEKDYEESLAPFGLEGTEKLAVEISKFPSFRLTERLEYLIRYPHGCVEQTTSSVFPQLFLETFTEINESQKENIKKNVIAGIERLKTFQTSDGGLAYWPGNSTSDEWGSNYAGHFIVEAKLKGFHVPETFFNNWLGYQTSKANNWRIDLRDNGHRSSSAQTQVYRLYLLALAGKGNIGAMNRFRALDELPAEVKWRLANAYQLMGFNDVAQNLTKGLSITLQENKYRYYNYGSDLRDLSMILESAALAKEWTKAQSLFETISEKLGENRWYSTQSTAYALLGISRYLGDNKDEKETKFSLEINGKTKQYSLQKGSMIIDLGTTGPQNIKVHCESEKPLFVTTTNSGIPIKDSGLEFAKNLTLSVQYETLGGKSINKDSIALGTDFKVKVRVRHNGESWKTYQNIALNYLFPVGWEYRNKRLEGSSSASSLDYQDIRDDRVFSYFSLQPGKSTTIEMTFHASFEGKFQHPGILVEAMYDNKVAARKPGFSSCVYRK